MDSACCWAVLSPVAGSSPVLVIFSISVSSPLTACSHVGNDGGALAVSSCLPAPPTFSTADIIHGPEMNIGTLPLAKSGSVVGVAGALLLEMPSVKYDW